MIYQQKIEELLQQYHTREKGLTSEEASKRKEKYGTNEIPKEKGSSVIKLLWEEIKNPIVLLLMISVFASFLVGEKIDAIAILFIIIIDLVMGVYQENKANKTASALRELVRIETKAYRDNEIEKIDAKELVIGDIVLLESGDKIPADLRIMDSHNVNVDESILTGESLQVEKDSKIIKKKDLPLPEQKNMLFAGTNMISGRVKAMVVATGLNTEIGKIANCINQTKEEKSPLTIRIEQFSKQISFLILIVALFIAILLMVKQVPYHQIFLSVVALAVSAMPEGLPLALTMSLTIASNKMAKKNVIVRKLNAVESLGSCTVIASDKTGTLTVNEQTAKKILLPNQMQYEISGTGYHAKGEVIGKNLKYAKEIAFCGVINNEAQLGEKLVGDSIDIAFLILGKKLNIERNNTKILNIISYESENKYSAVFYEKKGEVYCTVKGSLEKVKEFCNKIQLTEEDINSDLLENQNISLAKEGYRVIAIANGKVEKKKNYEEKDIKNLTFMGLVGFIDPIRTEAISSIQQCHSAGIKVLMITGDHPLTAFSIAKEVKLANSLEEVVTGIEVEKVLKKGQKEFDEFVRTKRVFARVTPLQKLAIIESLKRQKEFVAVTGDGVNDAPALKSANIGIAMGSGTDIAKEVADMIVIDDNFKSITAGIKEGRVAYANIRKIIFFLISCGFAEVLFFSLAILFNLPMPLVAIQLLWLNMVTDGIQDFALSFEKSEKNIMKEHPRTPKEPLFDRNLSQEILISGGVIGILVFICWYYLIQVLHIDVIIARGYIMAFMVFIQNIHVFNCRSEKTSAFQVSMKNNYFIVLGVAGSLLLQILVMKVPVLSKILQTTSLSTFSLISLFFLSTLVLWIMEIYKNLKRINQNEIER